MLHKALKMIFISIILLCQADCQTKTDNSGYRYLAKPFRNIPTGAIVLRCYSHFSCGSSTCMSEDIAETLYSKPNFYEPYTFCVQHREHFHLGEMLWIRTNMNMFHWYLEHLAEKEFKGNQAKALDYLNVKYPHHKVENIKYANRE